MQFLGRLVECVLHASSYWCLLKQLEVAAEGGKQLGPTKTPTCIQQKSILTLMQLSNPHMVLFLSMLLVEPSCSVYLTIAPSSKKQLLKTPSHPADAAFTGLSISFLDSFNRMSTLPTSVVSCYGIERNVEASSPALNPQRKDTLSGRCHGRRCDGVCAMLRSLKERQEFRATDGKGWKGSSKERFF